MSKKDSHDYDLVNISISRLTLPLRECPLCLQRAGGCFCFLNFVLLALTLTLTTSWLPLTHPALLCSSKFWLSDSSPWLCIGSGQLAMSDSPPAPVTKYWYNNTHQVSPPTNHWAHQTTFKWITNWMSDSVKLYFRNCFPDKLLNPRHSVVSTLI